MYETGLIFSRSGDRRRLYPVSPYLYSQFGPYNKFILPKRRDLPSHGLITRLYAFDFGFSIPGNALAPYDTGYSPLIIGRDLLVLAVTKVSYAAAPNVAAGGTLPIAGGAGANGSPAFLVNWLHTHGGVQRQWSNKNITDGEAGGTGRKPMILRDPALLAEGDTMTCVVQNMLNATLQVQLLFTCGEFDTETFGQEAGV